MPKAIKSYVEKHAIRRRAQIQNPGRRAKTLELTTLQSNALDQD
jgi:hypothetical protein